MIPSTYPNPGAQHAALPLAKLREALRCLENSCFWTVSHDPDVARDYASSALLTIAQALGLSEREVEVIRAMVVAAEKGVGEDYSSAIANGEVIIERAEAAR